MTDLFVQNQWCSSPVAYWTIKYEYQRNGVDMQYRFYWKVWIKNSASYYYNGLKLKLFLNGTEKDITVKSYNKNEAGWSYEGTTEWYTVSNKISGTTSFYAQLYDTNTKTTEKTSSTYALTVSPSASTVQSATDFTDESNPTITFENLGGFSVAPYINIYNDGVVIHTIERAKAKYTSPYTFSLTDAERTAMRNACNMKSEFGVAVGVATYDGDTNLGASSKVVKMNIVNANPTYDASKVTYKDTNDTTFAVTGNRLHIVQNKSTLSVVYEKATANKGATITSYKFTLNDVEKVSTTAGGTVPFGTINSSKNLKLTCVVTDSRGNTTTVMVDVTVFEYIPPTATISLYRLNNHEDTTYLTVDANYSSVNKKNTVTITYKYAKYGDGFGAEVSIQDNKQVTLSCDKNSPYMFFITVKDAFGEKFERISGLPKGKYPLFIHTDRNAVGVNEYCADDEAFRVADGIAHFEDGIRIGEQNVVDYIIEQGNYDMWTYRKWASGIVECWGITSFASPSSMNSYGNAYYCNVNLPKLPISFSMVRSVVGNVYAPNYGLYWLVPYSIENDVISCRLVNVEATPRDVYVYVTVKGTWK